VHNVCLCPEAPSARSRRGDGIWCALRRPEQVEAISTLEVVVAARKRQVNVATKPGAAGGAGEGRADRRITFDAPVERRVRALQLWL
jgi:hypothetical protein